MGDTADNLTPEGQAPTPETKKEPMESLAQPGQQRTELDELVNKLREALSSERGRSQELERSLRHLEELFEHIDRRGKKLGERLDQLEKGNTPIEALIRTDELDLISRYSDDIGRHALLIQTLSAAKRTISMARLLLFEPMYHLDNIVPDIGKKLYGAIVRRQDAQKPALAPLEMEALARYTRQLMQPTERPDLLALQRTVREKLCSEGYLIDRDKDYVDSACAFYWDEMRTHRLHYQSLDKTARRLIELRDLMYSRTWGGMLGDYGEFKKKHFDRIPVLGLRMDTDALKAYVLSMQHYEEEHRIDLGWFHKLPEDLASFSKD